MFPECARPRALQCAKNQVMVKISAASRPFVAAAEDGRAPPIGGCLQRLVASKDGQAARCWSKNDSLGSTQVCFEAKHLCDEPKHSCDGAKQRCDDT